MKKRVMVPIKDSPVKITRPSEILKSYTAKLAQDLENFNHQHESTQDSQEPLFDHRALFLTEQKQYCLDSLRKSPNKAEYDPEESMYFSEITSSYEDDVSENPKIEVLPIISDCSLMSSILRSNVLREMIDSTPQISQVDQEERNIDLSAIQFIIESRNKT